jgi:hypothetical protein
VSSPKCYFVACCFARILVVYISVRFAVAGRLLCESEMVMAVGAEFDLSVVDGEI